mmetsp:Transcript_14344/g.37725  ORF Transcript_14344/g.37725 Transcript_14344/m.37725 type:complete len:97 (+) Transcript_14344:255-545(+)
MMCGCEAKPAGGTMEKALAGGGCGHEFNFKTLKPLGSGSPGNPANERQVNFAPKPMPKPKPNLPPTDAKVDPFDPRRAEEPPTDDNLIIQELREVS